MSITPPDHSQMVHVRRSELLSAPNFILLDILLPEIGGLIAATVQAWDAVVEPIAPVVGYKAARASGRVKPPLQSTEQRTCG